MEPEVQSEGKTPGLMKPWPFATIEEQKDAQLLVRAEPEHRRSGSLQNQKPDWTAGPEPQRPLTERETERCIYEILCDDSFPNKAQRLQNNSIRSQRRLREAGPLSFRKTGLMASSVRNQDPVQQAGPDEFLWSSERERGHVHEPGPRLLPKARRAVHDGAFRVQSAGSEHAPQRSVTPEEAQWVTEARWGRRGKQLLVKCLGSGFWFSGPWNTLELLRPSDTRENSSPPLRDSG
ncbi:hypothetical protein EYF80_051674 [Liparis tanakae]|uniref:Uncharacterized protein n=1 Tax=Liparis tanakae TaxID=230148 RepID=A0A4Z2FAE5_9TELE|nr:hypothetical protein EYF80_051674 [Liparis tanakae]